MKHYVGLDISMKETFVCVVDELGKKIREKSLPSEPEVIAKYLTELKLNIELIGLESGSISHWMTLKLLEEGLPVKCIDARHIAAVLSVNINKTDRNDARGIADAMRCKLFKEVRPKSASEISVNTMLNSRKMLVEQKTQLLSCIRGLLKPYGIRLGSIGTGSKSIRKIEENLKDLPQVAKRSIEELIIALKSLLNSIKAFEEQIKDEVVANDRAKQLITVPGVGPITALRFLGEIGSIERFSKSKSVGAYVGMTPRQYSSGETQKQGRISKCGPKELRSLLTEAGLVILTRTKSWSKLKAWGKRIQSKHGTKKAAVAVGRKLSVILHRMLKTGELFRFTDQKCIKAVA